MSSNEENKDTSSQSQDQSHTNDPNETNETKIDLQLGDIIKIISPTNELLNGIEFFITYIDKTKMLLLDPNSGEITKLKISADDTIGDGTITQLIILSRSESPSYAKQNGLSTGKWIDIHFGGDYPAIITGEITNVESDMIEVSTVDKDILYINFDYKGIPEDLPIEFIEIRSKPQDSVKEVDYGVEDYGVEDYGVEGVKYEMPELEREKRVLEGEKIQLAIPTKNVKDQLREFIIKADQIKFGNEEFGPIVQFVDVASKSQRYSIETQLSDLLDELLSTIPNSQRTQKVLNNIHIIIERFKQLRERFSTFDQYGNVEGALINESSYKPLTQYFNNFNQNLYWILPVVKNIKKVYNVDNQSDENNDIINIELNTDITRINDVINNYKSNTLPSDQNKYSYLYSELNPYFTPFDLINDENNSGILIEKNVESNINVVINNLEEMYSSVFSNNRIRSRRFVIQKYNMGLTKLDTIDNTSSRLVSVKVNMTNPDTLSIKSFITLPEPTIRFSKINLPGTTLLDKANLNQIFLNYWEFLKNKTPVNEIFIDKINEEIEYNENNFVNNVKNYVLNLSDEDRKGLTNEMIYSQFIKTIIPKTKVIFNLMKKYIVGKLSIVDVVGYLEPFLIYSDNLTYMQYVEIVNFINEKISQYNKTFIERSRLFTIFKRTKSEPLVFTNAYSIISLLETTKNLRTDVFESYNINITEKIFTNSELLKKLNVKDNFKLYSSAISLQNAPLMLSSDFAVLFETEKEQLDKKIKDGELADKCKTMTISKNYRSLEELESDNGKTIYFDKNYDKTPYGLLYTYEKEIVQMTPDNFFEYLKSDLQKKQKLSDEESEYLSDTLINGHKKVLNNHYALLHKGYNVNIKDEFDYYVRKNNKWELDTEANQEIFTDESSILCNLQEKCINVPDKIDDKCESMKVDELSLQNNLLKNVINEFDVKYRISKDEYQKKIQDKYDYLNSIIGVLTKMETNNMLKYNNQKYKLGANISEETGATIISPNAKLLNLILGQSDFTKKQTDIIRFVNAYTRPPIREGFGPLNKKESSYWLYCTKTNVELLPVFRYDMASAYITNPQGYNDFVEQLITKIGKESDDGDYWTAEGSGWTIKKGDFDIEEGYEEGFKTSSRAIFEDDAGNKITSETKKIIKYDTPETKMISNIVNALSLSMGINMEMQKEFIVNCVIESIRDTLESESEYKLKIQSMSEKGKKISSYRDFYNTAVMYYTLGMFLIGIQTAIPSIKTRKTHPGCVRSFEGYPFGGAGDYSSLKYLACVAYDIRESSIEPWNVLKKLDIIEKRLKGSIDDVLLTLTDVKRKFDEKTDYLLISPSEKIPDEHNISSWINFLPPLFPYKIKRLLNISDDFKRNLISDLRSGAQSQREKLLVIDSKIIQFSLAIQEKIQEVVKRKSTLLQNSNNEPYLENACCQTKEGETTIEYFISQDKSIEEYNQIVIRLSNILQDVTSYSKGCLFYSNINTKNKYPAIIQNFDEKTIYLAFIYFCKFKSLMPIPEDLLPLCNNKPTLFLEDSVNVDEMIQKLKKDDKQYNNETFLRLLQIVGRNNIINVDLESKIPSNISKLSSLLEEIETENDEIVEGALRQNILNALDTFDIASYETTKEVKGLNDYLIRSIESMKEDIIEFIEKNRGSDITRSSVKKVKDAINNLSVWSTDSDMVNASNRDENIKISNKISNDSMYNIINFYKTFISYFVTLFPNIILNKVDFKNTLIQNYLGLSANHSRKIKESIEKYYETLQVFYGIPGFYNILNKIQKSSINLVKLSIDTPCFSSINYDGKLLKPVFDERTSRFLYEYYLLRVLINYIDLSEEDEMIVTEYEKSDTVEDLFTVEYLEETETKIDMSISPNLSKNTVLLTGNKKELRKMVSKLLINFIHIMETQKNKVDMSYDDVIDNIFKLKEKEKNMITDRLKNLTDEQRDVDTILKINKQGQYSKGLQKGLTVYDKDYFDEEREFRDEMDKVEKNLRKNNKDITDDNIDVEISDYLESRNVEDDIDKEAYDMSYLNEDFMDGNFDGDGAPEEEGDDYRDYD